MVNRQAANPPGPRPAAAFSGLAMTPFETVEIDEMVAACAGGPGGGGGPLGHPRVFLNLGPEGRVECPYCSRLFVNRRVAQASGERTPDIPPPGPVGSP